MSSSGGIELGITGIALPKDSMEVDAVEYTHADIMHDPEGVTSEDLKYLNDLDLQRELVVFPKTASDSVKVRVLVNDGRSDLSVAGFKNSCGRSGGGQRRGFSREFQPRVPPLSERPLIYQRHAWCLSGKRFSYYLVLASLSVAKAGEHSKESEQSWYCIP
ncbi:hypothetical protein M378DRAFT_169507, partial [Amanita muscaria Koide BX008]